ncbi:glycosyltransferase family 2 protein [Azonexus sp.]|uniref:glycosyltransferase family 2 protein n=1 Tax=Azonexus sp. TaxID=1872668 RepID=UPI0035AEA7BA
MSERSHISATRLSIVLPAKNESRSLAVLLPDLRGRFPDAEIIVVDDGSDDGTVDLCQSYGVRAIRHAYSKGNGAAIKSGARAAQGEFIVFMDADGQHRPQDIPHLLTRLSEGFDMAVGARIAAGTQAGLHRAMANGFYNRFASWMTGQQIMDLTSGFRAVRARLFKRFLYLLPNGFSYPTTCTMAFFRSGYSVTYEPIEVQQRMAGTASHIRPWRDGVRFLLIIFKIGTLFSPMKLFFPISMAFFFTGLGHYMHTYFSSGRFTNMSALLFITSVLVFLIGLVSEQITTLIYRDTDA